jgi:hypothetical protein
MSASGYVDRAAARRLAIVLRAIGLLDLCALLAVVMPESWMNDVHAWLGMGPLPAGAVVGYLARTASSLYALGGALFIFLSFDVERYGRVITFLALAGVVHGATTLVIDLVHELPPLWRYSEGPCLIATGILVLWLQTRVARRRAGIEMRGGSQAA